MSHKNIKLFFFFCFVFIKTMISFYLKHFGSYIKKTCFRIVMNSYIKKNEIWIEKYIFIQEYKSLEFLS
jgi:hypothetical protein